jgi:hypothetical protein
LPIHVELPNDFEAPHQSPTHAEQREMVAGSGILQVVGEEWIDRSVHNQGLSAMTQTAIEHFSCGCLRQICPDGKDDNCAVFMLGKRIGGRASHAGS